MKFSGEKKWDCKRKWVRNCFGVNNETDDVVFVLFMEIMRDLDIIINIKAF